MKIKCPCYIYKDFVRKADIFYSVYLVYIIYNFILWLLQVHYKQLQVTLFECSSLSISSMLTNRL